MHNRSTEKVISIMLQRCHPAVESAPHSLVTQHVCSALLFVPFNDVWSAIQIQLAVPALKEDSDTCSQRPGDAISDQDPHSSQA